MDRDDKAEQLIRDYNVVFDSPQGERVLKNLKLLAHYDGFFWPRANGGTDIYDVCREAGKRAVIAHIVMQLKKGTQNE